MCGSGPVWRYVHRRQAEAKAAAIAGILVHHSVCFGILGSRDVRGVQGSEIVKFRGRGLRLQGLEFRISGDVGTASVDFFVGRHLECRAEDERDYEKTEHIEP